MNSLPQRVTIEVRTTTNPYSLVAVITLTIQKKTFCDKLESVVDKMANEEYPSGKWLDAKQRGAMGHHR